MFAAKQLWDVAEHQPRVLEDGRSSPGTTSGDTSRKQPDGRCEARVQAVLDASSYSAVRRVRCRCHDGTLTLYGQLPNFHYIQVAINLAQSNADEGMRIRNELEVLVRDNNGVK